VLNDSLVGFLWLLVLLLALSLITIIRIKPPERASAADEPAQAPVPMPIFRAPGLPTAEPMQRRVPQAPLPVRPVTRPAVTQPPVSQRHVGQRPVGQRPVGQRPAGQQPGYAARHAPRDVPGQDAVPGQAAAARPRVSGGPPWGPAPRPPDLDPFTRSSDWPSPER
jgi:hypothetical protein